MLHQQYTVQYSNSTVLFQGNGIFYLIGSGEMVNQDTAKLVLPIMIALITFFAWIAAIVGVCVGCCCAPVQDVDEVGVAVMMVAL